MTSAMSMGRIMVDVLVVEKRQYWGHRGGGKVLSGRNRPQRKEGEHEAPGGHLSDRVPVRPGASASLGLRDPAAEGGWERRAAVCRAAHRPGRGRGRDP